MFLNNILYIQKSAKEFIKRSIEVNKHTKIGKSPYISDS